MVLFVRAANKGKVTHGKTPRVFYKFSTLLHFSGSSWSYAKDLLWVFFLHYSLHYILITLAWLKIVFRTHTQKVQKKKQMG